MCLFRAETCLFCASAAAAVLSILIVVASNLCTFSAQRSLVDISQNKLRSQLVCFTQLYSAIYSDSADEVAIIDCFRDRHTIGMPLMAVIQPEVDLRVSLHPPQSASTFAHKDSGDRVSDRGYIRPYSTVPAT